jgi:lysophospholipase L1-like esterase
MRIYCHGDSLTEGSDFLKPYTWPSLTAQQLGIDVVNNGIGGDTTGGMLGRYAFEVLQHRPEMVILLGGTNDLWWGLAPKQILANLASMVVQAQHYGIVPILALPLPCWADQADKQPWTPPEGGYTVFNSQIKDLVEKITTYAAADDLPLIDFFGTCFDKGGTLCTDLFLEDGLHANKAGHRRMADTAAALLRKHFRLGGQAF